MRNARKREIIFFNQAHETGINASLTIGSFFRVVAYNFFRAGVINHQPSIIYSPIIVTTNSLAPPQFLYSQKYIPCQVPRFSRPSVMGIVMLTPLKVDFACAGISSAPSSVCSYSGLFSGTMRLNIVSISTRTSGSAFSLMLSPQLVCLVNMFTMPVFGSFGNWLIISLVTKWNPLCFGFRIISICCIIFILFSVRIYPAISYLNVSSSRSSGRSVTFLT